MARVAGKIIGIVLGFVFGGGPAGAFVGGLLGHLHDIGALSRSRYRGSDTAWRARIEPEPVLSESVFMTCVIVLGAKMAKADGLVSREEVVTFRRVFRIPDSQVVQAGMMFDRARQSADGYEPYAAQLAQTFRHNPHVLEEVLTGLFMVAAADSVGLSVAKTNFLRRVAVLFGFAEEDFARIAARSGVCLPGAAPRPQADDPYAVLGVPESASNEDVKRTYRALIRQHHPDKLVAQGLPRELIDQATEKMKRINAAYATITKTRGMK